MKRFLPVLLILNALLLPCGCFALLVAVTAGPLLTLFATDIHITNATDDTLFVTPIGAIGPQGDRSPLPMFHDADSTSYSPQRGDFSVAPGMTLKLWYDWDDINLAEIVVENPSGQIAQLVADPNPTANQYHEPNPNTFTINDFSQLDPVAPNVLSAFKKAQQPFSLTPRILLFFIPWLTFAILFWMWKRTKTIQKLSPLTPNP